MCAHQTKDRNSPVPFSGFTTGEVARKHLGLRCAKQQEQEQEQDHKRHNQHERRRIQLSSFAHTRLSLCEFKIEHRPEVYR